MAKVIIIHSGSVTAERTTCEAKASQVAPVLPGAEIHSCARCALKAGTLKESGKRVKFWYEVRNV